MNSRTSEPRFVATLALARPAVASGNAVVQRIKSLYSAMAFDVVVPETTAGMLRSGFLLRFEGVPISVTLVDSPIPKAVCRELADAAIGWDGARAALDAHRCQIVVAALDPAVGHAAALNTAAYVTFVAGAIASLLPCEAVAWLPSGTLTSGTAFATAAAALSRRELPVMSWVRFDVATHDKATAAGLQATVRTNGLAMFVEREVFCGSRTHSLAAITKAVIEVANALIGRGPFVNAGDTMDLPGIGRAVARYDFSNDDRKLPVLVVDIDGAPPHMSQRM